MRQKASTGPFEFVERGRERSDVAVRHLARDDRQVVVSDAQPRGGLGESGGGRLALSLPVRAVVDEGFEPLRFHGFEVLRLELVRD